MKLITDLLNSIQTDDPVNKVVVGAHWTAVLSRYCGMASTVMSQKLHAEEHIRDAGELHKKSAMQLAQLTLSSNTMEAGIGLAALNALLSPPKTNVTHLNALQFLADNGSGKKIAIFGHFPNLEKVRSVSEQLFIFELMPAEGEFGIESIPEILPSADLVAITSNSIINHSLEKILAYANQNAYKMMLGPSTPLSPVLFDYGLDMLAGVRILDPDVLFLSISQGAIFKQVRGVELVTLTRN